MLTNKVSSVNCYDLNLLIIDAVSFKMFDNLKAKFNQQPGTAIRRRMSDLRIQLTRILITGGPCAGKTTAMADIAGQLTQFGYKVLIVPEAATLIMKGGAMIASNDFSNEQGFMFQKTLMKLQIALENVYVDIGNMVQDTNVVVLIDRGLLDGSAYVEPAVWQALLDELGINEG